MATAPISTESLDTKKTTETAKQTIINETPVAQTVATVATTPKSEPEKPTTKTTAKPKTATVAKAKTPRKTATKTPTQTAEKIVAEKTVSAKTTAKSRTTKSLGKVTHDIVKAVKTDPTISATPKNTSDINDSTLEHLNDVLTKDLDRNDPKPQLPLKELVKQYDSVSLLLQGGGALGAYQAGIYEGLHNQGIEIDRISGISIGALNTAIIAGNLPENRLPALKAFWETITQRNYTPSGVNVFRQTAKNLEQFGKIDTISHFMPWVFENGFLKQQLRILESSSEAFQTMMEGQRGFFKPRYFIPYDTTPNNLSYYTTDKLRETLEKYCDLSLVNDVNRMKVSVSAVNVRTGNFAIFSNENEELHYEHFIASGALPPGFPAVEIEGEFYWDGGMVSNTPLNEILSHEEHLKQLIFQVDLWDARGLVPETMLEIDERVKDIQYSSKTRMVTDFMAQKLRYTRLIKDLLQIIEDDPNLDTDDLERIATAREMTDVGVKNVIHLIYHKKTYERGYKDYEFSGTTMQEHWASGLDDIENTFRHPDWFGLPETDEIFVTHDIHQKRKKLSQN